MNHRCCVRNIGYAEKRRIIKLHQYKIEHQLQRIIIILIIIYIAQTMKKNDHKITLSVIFSYTPQTTFKFIDKFIDKFEQYE